MTYVLLAAGFVLLVKGADWMVGAASKIASRLGVPAFIVGLTIVAIGTSAPEATIGIFSGIKAANQITLGDVIGSSIVNIALILGITASILPLRVDPLVSRREIPLSFFIQACLLVMILTGFSLSRLEGGILLAGFIVFNTLIIVRTAKESAKKRKNDPLPEFLEKETSLPDIQSGKKSGKDSMPKLVLVFIFGLACLIFGGNLVVDNSVLIAEALGFSKEFIGLTVVALGTSLPELVTCVIAALKKEEDIAVGNIIGSNIFNVLFVLSVSSLLTPIQVERGILFDAAVMLGVTVLLFVPSFFRGRLSRLSGSVFLAAYIAYIAVKIANLGPSPLFKL